MMVSRQPEPNIMFPLRSPVCFHLLLLGLPLFDQTKMKDVLINKLLATNMFFFNLQMLPGADL